MLNYGDQEGLRIDLKSERHFLLTALVAALVIRGVWIFSLEDRPYTYDGEVYDRIAVNVIEGRGFGYRPGELQSWRPPLYPLFLAASHAFFGGSLLLVRVLQTLMGVATVLLVYLLGKELFTQKHAPELAALIIALYPGMAIFPGLLLTETLVTLLLVSALYVQSRIMGKPSISRLVLFGVLCGLTVLCRPAFLVFAFFSCALLFWYELRRETPHLKRGARSVGVILSALVLTLIPWTVRNYRVHRSFVPISTNGGVLLLESNNPQASGGLLRDDTWIQEQERRFLEASKKDRLSEAERSRLYTRWALAYIGTHPVHFLHLAVQRWRIFWLYPIWYQQDLKAQLSVTLLDVALWPFLILGVVLSAGSQRPVILYMPVLALAAVHMVFCADARFRFPLLPIFALFEGVGIGGLSELLVPLRKRRRPERRKILLAGALLLGVALAYLLTLLSLRRIP